MKLTPSFFIWIQHPNAKNRFLITIAWITLTSVLEACILIMMFMQVVITAESAISSIPFARFRSNFFSGATCVPCYSNYLLPPRSSLGAYSLSSPGDFNLMSICVSSDISSLWVDNWWNCVISISFCLSVPCGFLGPVGPWSFMARYLVLRWLWSLDIFDWL